jgi:hypothetical protein
MGRSGRVCLTAHEERYQLLALFSHRKPKAQSATRLSFWRNTSYRVSLEMVFHFVQVVTFTWIWAEATSTVE